MRVLMSPIGEETVEITRIHVHQCTSCGKVSRRDEPDGIPDPLGAFHCSTCEHVGPLNLQIVEESDPRLHH